MTRAPIPLLFLPVAFLAAPAARAAGPVDLTVMSFNVRVGSADQGTPNDWDLRKDLVVATIDDVGPDLLGVQEALRYQWKYIQDNSATNYTEVGQSVNGDGTSEYCSILYKTSRFNEVDRGNFWLNPTDTPGVLGWDAGHVRVVSWVELQDKKNPGLTFLYLNTHWDNVGVDARLQSAILMRQTIASLVPNNIPVIVSGDFNADQGGTAYRRMTGLDNADSYRDYNDTYRQIHPEDSGTVGTSLGFDGKGSNDGRIDWILQNGLTTLDATIDRYHSGTQYPSDHFPITATLVPIPEPGMAMAAVALATAATLVRCRSRPRVLQVGTSGSTGSP